MRFAAFLTLSLALPAAAHAEVKAPPANGSGDVKLICKTIKKPGTLLEKQRICKTRDKWIEDKAATRQVIDRAQVFGTRQ